MKYAALVALFLATPVYASGDHNNEQEPCSHPVFVTHDCLAEYETHDGEDGRDGADGIDGVDGLDGRPGLDGLDGVVPQDWYHKLKAYEKYNLATSAAQVYLPQDADSRITMGAASFRGKLGIGLGYAYMTEDKVALTVALGVAGSSTAAKVSVGFEF
jgi:hypothetical protein